MCTLFVFFGRLPAQVPHPMDGGSPGGGSDTAILVVLFVFLVLITVFTVYKHKTRDNHL